MRLLPRPNLDFLHETIADADKAELELIEARQTGESITRELLYLSGGTADQVYLAVRLAICRLALGEDTPLILDDALVRFDDRRMKSALALLREEAKTRQIILFTCRNFEERDA